VPGLAKGATEAGEADTIGGRFNVSSS